MLGLQVVETAVAVGGAYFFMPKNPDLKDPVLRVCFHDMLSLCELVKCMVRECFTHCMCRGDYCVLRWLQCAELGSAQLLPLHCVTLPCMLLFNTCPQQSQQSHELNGHVFRQKPAMRSTYTQICCSSVCQGQRDSSSPATPIR